jgi:protein-glutamine gamma-glutamyltransferase
MLSLPSLRRPAARQANGGLPREARDTLFLLVVVGGVVLLQVQYIPLWCTLLTLLVLGWRARLAWRSQPLPAWTLRFALLAVALAATWFTHRTILGPEAGVTLIVVLLALKTLELRARRDAYVIFFLSFFTLLTHFFHSQSLLTAVGILLALLGLLTGLVNAHMPVGKPSLWQSARMAGGMALLGAPIMVVMFMLFPRMAPLWGIPTDGPTGRSGLSGQMRVGEIASLALDDSIAFRIEFTGAPPPQDQLYFRGPVLSRFDGREWRQQFPGMGSAFDPPSRLEVGGEPVSYRVTLEPSSRPWLMVLDATPEAPEVPGHQPFMSPDLQWITRRPITDLLRYDVVSYPQYRLGTELNMIALRNYIDLPPGFNPRTLQLAQDLRNRPGASQAPAALVNDALNLLRTGGYTYTLEPGVYGTNTADEFWFDRKEGFCEHIASSFVILMRAMDIPARVVTGYQGGERNPVDGFWAVRQRDAHAWAEVWLEGQGWVRIDPTQMVAPGRTASLERLRPAPNAVERAMYTFNPTLSAQARALWEAANNRWNQTVLNYTQSRQLDLLRALGFRSPSWTDLAYVLLGVIALVSTVSAGWALWDRQRHDPWLRLLEQARSRLRRAGLEVPENATPRQLRALLPQHPALARHDLATLQRWLHTLEAQRYDPDCRTGVAELRRVASRLPWPSAPARKRAGGTDPAEPLPG